MPSTILGEHALTVPTGTTAQRPASPTAGMIRMNTSTGYLEYYDTTTTQWIGIGAFAATGGTEVSYTVSSTNYKCHRFMSSGTFTVQSGVKSCDYLVVAGGGYGGGHGGGGGGAGGMLSGSYTFSSGVYSITVGAGAAAYTTVNGDNSSIGSLVTATGGGRGSWYNINAAAPGGSGGGATFILSASNGAGGSGTSGQGNPGGTLTWPNTGGHASSGGGGKGATGGTPASADSPGGPGGIGATNTLYDGTTAYYFAGGGGGATHYYPGGPGGSGGGGGGSTNNTTGGPGGTGGLNNGTAGGPAARGGTGGANTGGGGGGGGVPADLGGFAGSGIVLIRYTV